MESAARRTDRACAGEGGVTKLLEQAVRSVLPGWTRMLADLREREFPETWRECRKCGRRDVELAAMVSEDAFVCAEDVDRCGRRSAARG